MTEEYELYKPKCSDETMVVYRGEESYSPPYLDLKEERKVDVKHKDSVWGGYDRENKKYEYYDEPHPRATCGCDKTVYSEKPRPEPVRESVEEPEEPEPEEEETEEAEEERPPVYRTEHIERGYIKTSNLTLFLGGLILGLIAMYIMMFVLGPYIILVP